MSTMIQVICGNCGSKMDCPESDNGKTVLCDVCWKAVEVKGKYIAPDADSLLLEKADSHVRSTRDDFVVSELKEGRELTVSLSTPAAPPVQAKDPDKALANIALGVFRLNNWPCQEANDYRSFTVTVKFRSKQRGIIATDEFLVYAREGVLYVELMALEMPELPGIPVLETLNHINQRSVSSIFIQRPDGIIMRHAMIPRTKEEGYFTAKMLLQTVRQMDHDRRAATSLLRQVVETGTIDPIAVSRVFSQPLASSPARCPSLDDLADLAGFAGYYAQVVGDTLCIARQPANPDYCPLRVSASAGYVRAWTVLGDASRGNFTWNLLPLQVRSLFKSANLPSAGKVAKLMEELNTLHQTGGVVRFVNSQKNISGLATLFATDMAPSMEQFKTMLEVLLTCSESGKKISAALKASGTH